VNPPGFVTWGQGSSGTSPSWRSSPATSNICQLRQMWSLMRSPGCLLCPPPPLLKSQPSPHRFGPNSTPAKCPTSQYSQPSATTPTHQVAAGRCRRAALRLRRLSSRTRRLPRHQVYASLTLPVHRSLPSSWYPAARRCFFRVLPPASTGGVQDRRHLRPARDPPSGVKSYCFAQN
jgi:hypothetical protein